MSDGAAIIDEIQTRTTRCTLRADGIIVQNPVPFSVHSLDDARANIAAFAKLAKGRRAPGIVDMRISFSMGRGVREYYSGPDVSACSNALAFLMSSKAGSVVGNMFLGLSTPKIPTRIFTVEADAVAWLLQIDNAFKRAGMR